MTKVLVIPDVHLKPWMFDRAEAAVPHADAAVVLGDLVDDWGRQGDRAAYADTVDAAMAFDSKHPGTLWCVGNHDYCYRHFDEGAYNTGFSEELKHFVRSRLQKLPGSLGDRLKIVHELDGVLFSHAGVGEAYVKRIRKRLGEELTLAECVEFTNELASKSILWNDDSPLRLRPSARKEGVGWYGTAHSHTFEAVTQQVQEQERYAVIRLAPSEYNQAALDGWKSEFGENAPMYKYYDATDEGRAEASAFKWYFLSTYGASLGES